MSMQQLLWHTMSETNFDLCDRQDNIIEAYGYSFKSKIIDLSDGNSQFYAKYEQNLG